MVYVTITASGSLIHGEGSSASSSEPPLRLLGCPVRFASGVTLGSIVQLLEASPTLQEISPLTTPFLDLFSHAAGGESSHSGFFLSLTRIVELKAHPGEPRVNLFISLEAKSGDTTHPLDLFGPADLASMPLTLGPLRHIVFGDALHSEIFHTDYTLFEVLDAIFWELSFYWDKSRCGIRGP